MTVQEIQRKLGSYPSLDIDLLLVDAINRPKEFLYAHPEYYLTLRERARFWYTFFNYKHRYSIAAITGHKEFYGLDFYVNKNVLIPRPDTELLVSEAINEIKKNTDADFALVDVGTGSGCIPISILKNLPQPAQTYAIDISRKALRVAKKNAKKHSVSINFLHGNLLKPILKKYKIQAKKLIITANLPYLTKAQFKKEPSIQKEPKIALVAKKNGLALYENLCKQIKLLPTPYALYLLLEIDPAQQQPITTLIKKHLPVATIETKKDLAGLDRLVIVRVGI